MCSEVEAGNFATLVYSALIRLGTRVLKIAETVWENNLIIVNGIRIIHVNFIIIAITYSEKKLEALFCNIDLDGYLNKTVQGYADVSGTIRSKLKRKRNINKEHR
jgi:hypothetical protein